MPDTYGHKPSADELLHDLASIDDNGSFLFRDDTPDGPSERIFGAVQEYKATPDWDAFQPPTPDHYQMVLHIEHGMWQEVCGLLHERGIGVNDDDKLMRTIEMWGEHLADLRVNQTSVERQMSLNKRMEALKAVQEVDGDAR